ncbi:hypothetical protein HCC30_04925 [Streptomyces sp. HNM0574]|nr:hypothetical protein [Streptomyces sp. HNM0574]
MASWIRGRIEQCIANLLAVLEARQIPLPDAERKRITSCRDSAALDRWFRRALTATTLDEVFAEEDEAAVDRVAGG